VKLLIQAEAPFWWFSCTQ